MNRLGDNNNKQQYGLYLFHTPMMKYLTFGICRQAAIFRLINLKIEKKRERNQECETCLWVGNLF